MASYLFSDGKIPEQSLLVEGFHHPGDLTRATGLWIHAAGSMILESGEYPLTPHDQWIWMAVENGALSVEWGSDALSLKEGDACVFPMGSVAATLRCQQECRCLWLALDGPLAPSMIKEMGVLLHSPLKQGALPSQMYLARQIVQVVVRHNGTSDATYQLQQLMFGMLASHAGQPVAMDAMLSHEIAKVVDTLRANQYRDNLSLAEMAAISRMPMETFRKRFVSEVGMPPLSYVLHCKMERAKELLQAEHYSVRQAGAEVGMKDPYHFSKQFKHIVGISPSAFVKQAGRGTEKKGRKRS